MLRTLWEGWKKIARKIGDFQARIILIIFYFVFLAPFALILRMAGDPLTLKTTSPHGWLTKDQEDMPATVRAHRQF
ncbi:MAG: hypothetical protein C5B54_09330 [Acidobacteria bacterium]|nr:MAG: hypothetical protein C5B54_09330 [Acidobacteriota bacterium]